MVEEEIYKIILFYKKWWVPLYALIPYTTLFRSYEADEAALETLFASAGAVESVNVIRDRETGRARGFAFVEMATDRKSTRLNSSHLVNSYAVFCWKKKIKCR